MGRVPGDKSPNFPPGPSWLWMYPTLFASYLQVFCLRFTIFVWPQIGGWVQIPKLREVRELQGLTQKDLAEVSGVSLRSIAGYEGGARVRPNTARKLANALDVEVVDLVGVDVHPKARALSPHDADPGTALPEDEVLFEAYYTPENFEEVTTEAQVAMREVRRHHVPKGMQIAYLDSGDKVEVRIMPVSPSSRARRRRRIATKMRNDRETA